MSSLKVFAGNIELRQDVTRKMLQRSQYRRTRRSRKLRHRKARFLNRGKKGWISPTIRNKKEAVLRVLNLLKIRLSITSGVVEQGAFDISSMSANYKLTSKEYQKSRYEGENFKNKVLWRDRFTCQKCKAQDNLQAHHINFRSHGGTNTPSKGVCLCASCHQALHKGAWEFTKKVKHFKYLMHLRQGKKFLFNELRRRLSSVEVFYGWMTSIARNKLGLDKDHFLDAAAMLGCSNIVCKPYLIKPRRKKVWEDNPTKKCTEKNGFMHFDLVKAKHRTKGIVIGAVRSLKKTGLTLRTTFNNNFEVSYKKSILLERPNGLIFTQLNTI